jgi:hypothetical protein
MNLFAQNLRMIRVLAERLDPDNLYWELHHQVDLPLCDVLYRRLYHELYFSIEDQLREQR